MERDFLGLSLTETVVAVKQEAGERSPKFRTNAVDFLSKNTQFIGRSGHQWPFLNKEPPFMSIKRGHVEDRTSKTVLERFPLSIVQPISTVDAFDVHLKASASAKFQTSFTLDTHNSHSLSQSQRSLPSATYPIPVDAAAAYQLPSELRPSHSIFTSTRSPYSKFDRPSVCTSPVNLVPAKSFGGGIPVTSHHSVLPVVAAAPHISRSVYSTSVRPPPPAAQLTIFYAGSVNVYDNVSLEKVQAIMSMMGNQPPVRENLRTLKPQISYINGFNDGLPSPASGTAQLQLLSPHSGVHSSGGSTCTDELLGVKVPSPFICSIGELLNMTSLQGGGTLISQGAIPQARKASLVRFLEKRKERVLSTAPYAKKPEASHRDDPATANATSSVAAMEDGATS